MTKITLKVEKYSDEVATFRYNQDGKEHTVDSEPSAMFEGPDGPRSKEWHNNGILHRVGGPAELRWVGKKLWLETWYQNGLLYRPASEGPAKTVATSIKKLLPQDQREHHRDLDYPGYVRIYTSAIDVISCREGWAEDEDGNLHLIVREYFNSEGDISHTSQPAVVSFKYGTNEIETEAWYKDGVNITHLLEEQKLLPVINGDTAAIEMTISLMSVDKRDI